MGKWSNLAVALLAIAAFGQVALTADYDGDGILAVDEVRGDTHAFVADSDNDGLRDDIERNLSTNSVKQDTDGDGLMDGLEYLPPNRLSSADPMKKDVFIEVDYEDETEPPRRELRNVKRSFENAPVENPDGSTGVDVHFVIDSQVEIEDSQVSVDEYFDNYHKNSIFQNKSYGYYHMLLVEDASAGLEDSNAVIGGTLSGEDGFIVEELTRINETGATTMHELGHVLGLSSSDFQGIDSTAYTEEEYPSVMNYNYRSDCSDDTRMDCLDAYRFSGENGAFNDWNHLEAGFDGPETYKVDKDARERLKGKDSYREITNVSP